MSYGNGTVIRHKPGKACIAQCVIYFRVKIFKGCTKLHNHRNVTHCNYVCTSALKTGSTRVVCIYSSSWLLDYIIYLKLRSMFYGHPERKQPSLQGRKFTPTPKFLGTAEKYFVCHIGPIFQISLIYAFIGCPQSVS